KQSLSKTSFLADIIIRIMVIKYHELTFPSIINNRQQQMIDNKNNLEGVEIHILILNISAAVYRSLI
ncbi:hypothetical protein KMA67_08690, partial [Enterococcus durans]|uniref:hypothetical protein n=1 Tax=Enterococcus durans TaxID=53345 RepID=UPI001D0A53B0